MNLLKLLLVLLILSLKMPAQQKPGTKPGTLRSILLEQLHTTHDQKDWFVPANVAVEELTANQASWTDGPGNHSVGQLTNHLIFWNRQEVAKFKGVRPDKFSGNNDETFNHFDESNWTNAVRQLDDVMKDLEKLTENATDAQLGKWASDLAHIGTHNAYHVGQIITIRKLQGSWAAAKGVK